MQKRSNQNNFTMVELLVVIAAIAILITLSGGLYRLVTTKLRVARTTTIIQKLELAMQAYRHETGYYFQSSGRNYEDFRINLSDTTFIKFIDYTSMKAKGEIGTDNIVVDAWGNPILYLNPGYRNSTMFDLGSRGPDGRFGDGYATDTTKFGQGDDITNFNRYVF